MQRGDRVATLVLFIMLLTAVPALNGGHASARPVENNSSGVWLPLVAAPDVPPRIRLQPYVTGFNQGGITGITHAGDERLFVLERTGRVRVVTPDGELQSKPFLDLHRVVSHQSWEEGLMGLAFHPQFPRVPTLYVLYTIEDNKIVVSRFQLDPENADQADLDSEIQMMIIAKKPTGAVGDFRVHNGGDLHFGPDGYLYIGIGDGGPDPWEGFQGDPHNKGQSRLDLMGSILRIDVNSAPGSAPPDCGREGYTIPPSNPFNDGASGDCGEIWATGLRNPYRFSFDRATGDMYISDVGEKLREEINFQAAGSRGGANYGWHCYEGTVNYAAIYPERVKDTCPSGVTFTMPIHDYSQDEKDCSVVGGYVYRGQAYPKLRGRYLFGDFCTGRAWLLTRTGAASWSASFAAATNVQLSTWGEDLSGELYAGEWRGDKIPPRLFRVEARPER